MLFSSSDFVLMACDRMTVPEMTVPLSRDPENAFVFICRITQCLCPRLDFMLFPGAQ